MKHFTKLLFITLLSVLLGNASAWGQTTYKLEQVTSVEAGGLYVFEQNGYVMNNTISSNALQTTNTYNTTGLAGTETYVWTLETYSSSSYYMKNCGLGSSVNCYLQNTKTKTNLSFVSKSNVNSGNNSGMWNFNFQTDGTAIIQNSDNSNRFLGFTSSSSHEYKAYATSNLSGSTYPHAIKVYKLVEETNVATTHSVTYNVSPTGAGAGTVSGNTTVAEDANITIEATPNATWEFAHWTVSGMGSSISDTSANPATFTMGTEDATVTAVFVHTTAAAPTVNFANATASVQVGNTYTNTFTDKPSDLTVTYSVTSGSEYASVDASTGEVTGVAVGTATITASWEAVEFVYNAGSVSYTIDVTAAQAVTTYEKITTTNELTDGRYLIVYETGNVAFDGSRTTLDATSNTKSVDINNNQIQTNEDIYFTINTTAGTIQSASGYYIGRTAASNGMNTSTTEAYTNTITFDNNNAIITSSGGPTLKFNSNNDQKRFRYFGSGQQAIQLYKEVNNNPTISANNVDIAYDATSGSITYTINNPVTGGVLTANCPDNWLTLGSVGATIPFTTTANNTVTARTATVTLTYTYNKNETATKTVTITQAADPNAIMTIAEVRAQETGDVKTQGIVTSCEGKTAYIQDNTAAVCVYNSSSNLGLSVGDEIIVEGSLTTYNGLLEIAAPLTISTVSTGNAVTPTVKTIAEINTDASGDNDLQGMYVKIVDATVTAVSVSGNSQSVTISQNGQTMTVYGGSLSVSANDVITVVGNIGCYNNVQIVHPQLVTFEITATSNNTDYGTVAVSGNTITATPASGYRVSTTTAYEVTSGTATVTQNGNTFTVTPTSDCTIRIYFEAIPTHTVTFNDNGHVSTETYAEGATITMPTQANIAEYTFVGWTTAEITGTQNNAPTLVESPTMSTSNLTYYAVYAEASGTEEWLFIGGPENVTEEGVYALLTPQYYRAFNGTINSSNHGEATSDGFVFDANNIATRVPSGICELTFTKVTGTTNGYTMYNKDHGYLYAKNASSGNLDWHNSETSYWEYAASNWTYQYNNAFLRTYSDTSFRTYGSNNNATLAFAKKTTVSSLTGYRTKVAMNITFKKQNTSAYYSSYNLTIPEDIIAKTYKVVEGKPTISKTYEAGETVAQGTAVILTRTNVADNYYNNSGDVIEFRLYSSGEGDINNKLVGWDEATLVSDYYSADEYIAYVLSTKNNANPGFYYMNGCTNGETTFRSGAHKVVFPVAKSAGSKASWLFSEIDDETTSISPVHSSETIVNNGVYDLQGRKVSTTDIQHLTPGIYIVNGKKIVIR